MTNSKDRDELYVTQNSLGRVRDVIEIAELKDNMVELEYQVPYNDSRIDCLLFGKDAQGLANVVLIELKQWEQVTATENEGNFVETFVGGNTRLEHAHKLITNEQVFSLINEQLVAKNMIMTKIRQSEKSHAKSVVIVHGGPGTGKSVIALNLLAEAAGRGKNVSYACKSKSFLEGLKKMVGKQAGLLFNNLYQFVPNKAKESQYDLVLVDEAHRIQESSNFQYAIAVDRTDMPQIEQLIRSARTSVFFIDDLQSVRTQEVGNTYMIRRTAGQLGARVESVQLESQFRCMGSNDYLLIAEPGGDGVPLSETAYTSNFPSATHARLYTYPDSELFYEFYQFSEAGIVLLGMIDTIPDEQWVEKITTNEFLATLPLSVNTSLVTIDTLLWKDTTYFVDIRIKAEGFGTLVTPAGNVEVLKIRNEYNEISYDENNDLIEEIHRIAYTFYSKFGHRLTVYLSEDSPATGNVDIEEVESEIVVFNSSSVPTVTEGKKLLFSPNPSTGIIRFTEKGNYDVYYLAGVKLRSFVNVSEADVSDLAKGIYLVKQVNGENQILILQ